LEFFTRARVFIYFSFFFLRRQRLNGRLPKCSGGDWKGDRRLQLLLVWFEGKGWKPRADGLVWGVYFGLFGKDWYNRLWP
jgi:hypothetical protein